MEIGLKKGVRLGDVAHCVDDICGCVDSKLGVVLSRTLRIAELGIFEVDGLRGWEC